MKKSNSNNKKILLAFIAIAILGVVGSVFYVKSYFARQAEAEERRDSLVINLIHQTSRLYTSEVTSRKTITYSSQSKFKLSIAGIEKNINIPLTKTDAVIPVSVKYKAFIDLDKVTRNDISIENDSVITITLPDPTIQETAVSIDHENEKIKKQLLGKGLDYETYQEMVRKAKEEAWNELSEDDQYAITETAKVSATDIIIPKLRSLGFKQITVEYREDFKIYRIKN